MTIHVGSVCAPVPSPSVGTMRSLLASLGRGVAAGLVAGLLLVTCQFLARLLLGVSPPAELVSDRVAPLLTIDQFFGLFGTFGGYNGIKQAGILGGTSGQLVFGVAIAVAVAFVARRSAARAWRLLAILTALRWGRSPPSWRRSGEELPWQHGYPARLVVPGMFGEKNLKWITKVEVVTEEAKGFYETQGWGPNFEIPTRSRFTGLTSGAQVRAGDTVVLSGTALGGNRGVARVEISVDGGSSWTDARITYPGTMLSWALWSYDWRPTTAGAAKLVVRATDRTGGLQIAEERGVVPQGATGYHKIDVTVV